VTPFAYIRAATLAEALHWLSQPDTPACALAGGTDLVVQLRAGKKQPGTVVDIKSIPELAGGITVEHGGMRIGALTTMAQLASDAHVQCACPALAEAAAWVGSVQIRQRATLAGNLGNASPAADTAPPLLAHGAQLELVSLRGRRQVALNEFFLAPGKTILTHGELIAAIAIPASSFGASAFARLARRRGVDLASVSVACCLASNAAARFAFGAAGPTPLLADDASGIFVDRAASAAEVDAAVRRVAGVIRPISDVRAGEAYRRAMALVLCRRAHAAALDRLQRSARA